MKKIIYTLVAMLGIFGAVSCSDMLEAESNSQLYDPSLSQKTDSVSYALGVLQAMQQLADQYYYQNELRGDLVYTTKYATTDLRNLSNFDADVSNKYDSVYLYYKVINNCNYYLKHRNTELVTGNTYVTANEYIAMASLRAWAYLQLVRQYGSVPYITEPVTTISEINAQQQVTSGSVILSSEAAYLESLKEKWPVEYWDVPSYGTTADIEIGGNGGSSKKIRLNKCFVPLNVVLGDLYLENGNYSQAADAYYDYIYYTSLKGEENLNVNYANKLKESISRNIEYPTNLDEAALTSLYANPVKSWDDIFLNTSMPGDVITYLPMASSVLNGVTSSVPAAFGYAYYGTLETEGIPVQPTEKFKNTYTTAPYYYWQSKTATATRAEVGTVPYGDTRFQSVEDEKYSLTGDEYTAVYKPRFATFYLYRTSTVYLHLAEAMNRMGYPDAAFAVLKTGLVGSKLMQFIDSAYVEKPRNASTTTFYPEKDVFFLSTKAAKMLSENKMHFLPKLNADGTNDGNYILKSEAYNTGIHFHGGGAVTGTTLQAKQSPYKYSTVIDNKIEELNNTFNLGLNTKSVEVVVKYSSYVNKDGAVVDTTITYTEQYNMNREVVELERIINEAPAKYGNETNIIDSSDDAITLGNKHYVYTTEDAINAMEDILCDEYALEFAFEGTRFSDLQRIARHKNECGYNGGGFGDKWLADKLKGKGKTITTQNCYLPFK